MGSLTQLVLNCFVVETILYLPISPKQALRSWICLFSIGSVVVDSTDLIVLLCPK